MLQQSDNLVQLASSTFDAHVQEILAPLILGATLVAIHSNGNLDFVYLHKILYQKQITCIVGVPSYLQQLSDLCEKGVENRWMAMRNVCCVGEYNQIILE